MHKRGDEVSSPTIHDYFHYGYAEETWSQWCRDGRPAPRGASFYSVAKKDKKILLPVAGFLLATDDHYQNG